MKGSKFLVQLFVSALFLMGATGAVAQDVEKVADLQEALPQAVEPSADRAEATLVDETISEVEVHDEATDAAVEDLFLSEPAKLPTGFLQCRPIPGCSYVFNPVTGCCEEVTGGLCPTGYCL